MKNLVFAFGPNNGYIYNAPKQWAKNVLPQELEELWPTLSDILCAAFGSDEDQYFMSYFDKSNVYHMCYGDKLPQSLKSWLVDETGLLKRGEQTRVALGPNDSFFAWDTNSMRWSNIPPGLEEDIQEWLSPSGWIEGPPRIVDLGANGTYFAVSEYGSISVSNKPEGLLEQIVSWIDKSNDFTANKIAHVSLSSFNDSQYVIIAENAAYGYSITKPTESFYTVIDSLADDATIKLRKERREKAAREAKGKAARDAEEAKRLADEKRKQKEQQAAAAKARAAQEREAALQAELPKLYASWKADYTKHFNSGKLLTIFPMPPRKACFCTETSCLLRKNEEGSLMACRHDIERLLRASGQYSLSWLRKESLEWHPDRFGLRCDVDVRAILRGKSTQLFVIFGELIDAEKEKEDAAKGAGARATPERE